MVAVAVSDHALVMPPLPAADEARNDPALVRLEGELGLSALARIERELTEAGRGGRPVIVVVAPGQTLDSTVLASLLAAARRARRAGDFLALVCPDAGQRRLLGLIGLTRVLRVQPSMETACAFCARWERLRPPGADADADHAAP